MQSLPHSNDMFQHPEKCQRNVDYSSFVKRKTRSKNMEEYFFKKILYVFFMFTYQYTNITFVMRKKKAFNEVFTNSYVKYREENSGGHLVLLDK